VTRRSGIATGILAATAAIATSEGLSALFNLRESPVLALGQTVIRLTPGPIAEKIISVVQHADKPLAVTSVVIAILLLGGLIGAWWQGKRLLAILGIVVLVVLASAAVLSRPHGSATGVVVCVISGVVVAAVLELLQRERPDLSPDMARRTFLRTAGIVVVATAVVGGASELLASRRRRRAALERVRASLRLPATKVSAPSGVDLGLKGQPPWVTPNGDFYRIDTALSPPLIDPADWKLRIHGMVDKELTLTYQDLIDRGLEDHWITLCCVSNEVGGDLIGNTSWGGVPIKGILEEVGIKDGADALLSTSDDGWTCGTPLAALLDGRDAILALTMNGEPLPVVHGFPVRQVVPGLYGYVSATKWVTEWEVTRFADFQAYWTRNGWSERGPIKTEARIDLPRGDVQSGTVTVAGVAWQQHTGIEVVEVRIDGGAWQKATLAKVPSIDTWVQWTWQWPADKGNHTIQARATNRKGEPQTADLADVVPDGATGYPTIQVSVT
jgi:DMSO/TMAO reductase YedYZ molybdopterin-dependent catalytic subunit